MSCPPSKRLRGSNPDALTSHGDPFGDEEEFTQDDLDEIDIIASQAVTAAAEGLGSRPCSPPSARRLDRPVSRENRRPGQPGNRQQNFRSDRDAAFALLEAQQAELKKKVQSLQSELQFKEAEITEMKTKLMSSDRNKVASPVAVNSSKTTNSLAAVHHGRGSSSSSPVGDGVFTREAFSLHMSSRLTAVGTPMKAKRGDRGACSSRCADTQEPSRPDPFLSIKPARLQHRGAVLLGLLLQQPLMPRSFGLSQLLALNLRDSSQLLEDFQLCSDLRPAVGAGEAGSPRVARGLAQTLAATGLSMLSHSPPAAGSRACPGAVLLLPLLDSYLSELGQTLVSLRSFCSHSSSDSAAIGSHLAGGLASSSAGKKRLEEAGLCHFSLADAGLTSLRLLRVLLTHSDEVVQAVLLEENPRTEVNAEKQTTVLSKIKTAYEPAPHTAEQVPLCSQNAVLQSLLRLCDSRLCESSSHTEQLMDSVMKTLCVLIERTSQEHSARLQCVVQAVCVCASTDSRLQTLSHCVSVLTSLSDHQILAQQLCSQHDPCVFLKLFHFIKTRPDRKAAKSDWTLLDLQVVTLVSRLTQGVGTWRADVQSTCQCNTQLVQTVVILLHRQWLDLRSSQESTEPTGVTQGSVCLPWRRSVAVSLLRECLLLLHWLLLHHCSFPESCRPLLHMYDQMIPAMRNNLREILQLSESEEVALEDLCRSEGDDADDMDADG
ncbi:ATR-interacting protein isoform X3 [Oryzias latipes]